MNNYSIKIRPGVVMSLILFTCFSILFLYILYPLTSTFGEQFISMCDFTAGGGGINACSNGIMFLNIKLAVAASVTTVLILTKLYFKNYSMKQIIIGLIYAVAVIPLNFALLQFLPTLFSVPYGEVRGAFNNAMIPFLLIINVIILASLALTIKSTHKKGSK